ncbi:MAG: hypothetical protein QXR17_07680 [Candidatus Bathyarchaeia archaeon]
MPRSIAFLLSVAKEFEHVARKEVTENGFATLALGSLIVRGAC